MTVVLWILVILALVYIRLHFIPERPSLPERREEHTCKVHVGERVYEIYPSNGETLEDAMGLHRVVVNADENRRRLVELRRFKWGHSFGQGFSCCGCGLSLRDYHSTSESERRQCR